MRIKIDVYFGNIVWLLSKIIQIPGLSSHLYLNIETFTKTVEKKIAYTSLKGDMSYSVTNYNYVGNTKVSVLIKRTNANKCTLGEIFLTEILKSFSVF